MDFNLKAFNYLIEGFHDFLSSPGRNFELFYRRPKALSKNGGLNNQCFGSLLLLKQIEMGANQNLPASKYTGKLD
jgi:hypothetical protein